MENGKWQPTNDTATRTLDPVFVLALRPQCSLLCDRPFNPQSLIVNRKLTNGGQNPGFCPPRECKVRRDSFEIEILRFPKNVSIFFLLPISSFRSAILASHRGAHSESQSCCASWDPAARSGAKLFSIPLPASCILYQALWIRPSRLPGEAWMLPCNS